MDSYKFFKQVPRLMLGQGSYSRLGEVVEKYREQGPLLFFMDEVHEGSTIMAGVPNQEGDFLLPVEMAHEPTTAQVNDIVAKLRQELDGRQPGLVVGIGGGSTMDVAKAISVLLTNQGKAELYQGWDLVKNTPLPKMAVVTLAGTGSEASRTAVLTSSETKYGITSDHSIFDLVMLDSQLLKNVPNDQRFHTGMDCYIHSVESIEGSFINTFGMAFASKALELCRGVFLGNGGTEEDLMVASYLGGASVANSEVGVAHALSYGISLVLGFRHGIANCIVFNQLDEFYPAYVPEFRQMMELNGIELPQGVTRGLADDQVERMVDMTLRMSRPLSSALGEDWRNILTREKIRELYSYM